MTHQTIFSPDRIYRYTLWREWLYGTGYAMFIGLNPSTADETNDDPTVRRCIGFAKAWGFSALCMTNIFAFSATDPRRMMAASDPVGPENYKWLRILSADASVVIAAWGVHGLYIGQDRRVCEVVGAMDCLGLTKGGHPRHPLYVPANIMRARFNR